MLCSHHHMKAWSVFALVLLAAGHLCQASQTKSQDIALEPFSYDQLTTMPIDHSGSYRPFGWARDGRDSMTRGSPQMPSPVAYPFRAPSMPADLQRDNARQARFREVFPQQTQPNMAPGVDAATMASDPAILSTEPLTPAMAAARQQALQRRQQQQQLHQQQQQQQARFLEENARMYANPVPITPIADTSIPSEAPDVDPANMDAGDQPSASRLVPVGRASRLQPLAGGNSDEAGDDMRFAQSGGDKTEDKKEDKSEDNEDDDEDDASKEDKEAEKSTPPPPDNDGDDKEQPKDVKKKDGEESFDDNSVKKDGDKDDKDKAGGTRTKPTPLVELNSGEDNTDGDISTPAVARGPLHKCVQKGGAGCTVEFDPASVNWKTKTVPKGTFGGPASSGDKKPNPLDKLAPGLAAVSAGPPSTSGPIKAAQAKLKQTRQELINDIRWVQQVQKIVAEYQRKMQAVKQSNVNKATQLKVLSNKIKLMRKKEKEARLEKELQAALGSLRRLEGTSQSLNKKINNLSQTKSSLKQTINRIQSALGKNVVLAETEPATKAASENRFREKMAANEHAKTLFSGLMRFLETQGTVKAESQQSSQQKSTQQQEQQQEQQEQQGQKVPVAVATKILPKLKLKHTKADPLVSQAMQHGDRVLAGIRELNKRRAQSEAQKLHDIMTRYK